MHIRRVGVYSQLLLVFFLFLIRTRSYSQIVCIPQCLRATAKTAIEINGTASRTQPIPLCLTQSNEMMGQLYIRLVHKYISYDMYNNHIPSFFDTFYNLLSILQFSLIFIHFKTVDRVLINFLRVNAHV